jgi:hypothetical protein
MADTTKRRARRGAKRVERQRRTAIAARNPTKRPPGPGRGELRLPDWPEDPDGGAGVREPRRPSPTTPAGAVVLDEPETHYLDLVG